MMELTGFATKLASRVFMTSPRPCGTTSDSAASARTTVWGKTKLARAAMAAARKVVSIYSQMTVPNRRSSLDEPCASALATMTKTSTGAMPFSAPTNRVPSSPIQPAPGTAIASTAPTTRPIRMRTIRLMPLYRAAAAFNVFIFKPLLKLNCTHITHSFSYPLQGNKSYYSGFDRKSQRFQPLFGGFHLKVSKEEDFSLSVYCVQHRTEKNRRNGSV